MNKKIVLTLLGPDQVGIVEKVTQIILKYNGNVDESKMSRLSGAFAILMLTSLPVKDLNSFEKELESLTHQGYKFTLSETSDPSLTHKPLYHLYQISVNGADHEGIIFHITQNLAQHQINIEEMETYMNEAPMSGSPLFTMEALIKIPREINIAEWENELTQIGDEMNVDIDLLDIKDIS